MILFRQAKHPSLVFWPAVMCDCEEAYSLDKLALPSHGGALILLLVAVAQSMWRRVRDTLTETVLQAVV